MKILQLIQKPQLRGAEIFACQLSNHLLAQGHEVVIVCLVEGSAQLPFKGKLIYLNRPLNKRLVDVKGWRQLAKVILDYKPDIIQANAGDTLKYAVLSKRFFRWKVPIIFRNASTMSQYIKSWPAKKWNTFLFRQVRAVISVSEKSRQDFISLFPFMKNHIQVIPVGLELVEHGAKASSAIPYILHVGGFTFEKNHERLLHIFSRLEADHPGLELWLTGDGPLRKNIEELAKKLDLSDKVKFLGYRSDVLPLMQGAKALVLPSIIEGLPGVILEAMFCKTPVIAYAVGGIPEIVKPGMSGWLVKAGDEPGFVKAVNEALRDPHETIIENAFRLVTQDYDNKTIATRFLAEYQALILKSKI